jgi:GH24 family phage-related lysozyme (muramidase)
MEKLKLSSVLPNNWRFFAVILGVMVGVSFAVNLISAGSDISQLKAEAAAAGNTLDDVPSVFAEAFARTTGSLYGILDLANFLLVVAAAVLAVAGLRFFIFPSTLGGHKGEKFNTGWEEMTQVERTRWVILLVLVVLFGALVGRGNAADSLEKQYGVPMVEDESLALHISEKARDLIIYYEVGGKSYYESRLQRPTVPAWRTTASGVTVMFGVDVGHMTDEQIETAMRGIVPGSTIRALQSVNGLKGSSAYYSGLPKVRHLSFTWDQATKVFENDTLPRFTRQTANAFKVANGRLHPHENGALTSLVFNRGPSMSSSDRRREMRSIRYDIGRGYSGYVPGHIRSMKRLWSYSALKGLHLRRDAEARLFSEGSKLRLASNR